MSQPHTDHAAADRRAATAVMDHHSELAKELAAHTGRLRAAVIGDSAALVWDARDALLGWLRTELVPHAVAEESTLYPAAAAQPAAQLLVESMLAEHEAIIALVAEVENAATPVDAAAAARAVSALFEVHLAKENAFILPLLLATEGVSLAELLEGMHDLLGDEETGGGCGGGGGGCGCGGDSGPVDAPAPVLTVDARLDVRELPHGERHARVFAALDALPTDGALVLIAPHAPRPLLSEIDARYPGQIDMRWLQDGPEVWQIRLRRQAAAV